MQGRYERAADLGIDHTEDEETTTEAIRAHLAALAKAVTPHTPK